MPSELRKSSFPRGEPRSIVEQLFAWPSPFWARLLPSGFPLGEQLKVCSSPRMRRADIALLPRIPAGVDYIFTLPLLVKRGEGPAYDNAPKFTGIGSARY